MVMLLHQFSDYVLHISIISIPFLPLPILIGGTRRKRSPVIEPFKYIRMFQCFKIKCCVIMC